jgi:hypothetical protein
MNELHISYHQHQSGTQTNTIQIHRKPNKNKKHVTQSQTTLAHWLVNHECSEEQ